MGRRAVNACQTASNQKASRRPAEPRDRLTMAEQMPLPHGVPPFTVLPCYAHQQLAHHCLALETCHSDW